MAGLARNTPLVNGCFDPVSLTCGKILATKQVDIRLDRVLLKQERKTNENHCQQKPGKDARAGVHGLEQIPKLGGRSVQEVHSWKPSLLCIGNKCDLLCEAVIACRYALLVMKSYLNFLDFVINIHQFILHLEGESKCQICLLDCSEDFS